MYDCPEIVVNICMSALTSLFIFLAIVIGAILILITIAGMMENKKAALGVIGFLLGWFITWLIVRSFM